MGFECPTNIKSYYSISQTLGIQNIFQYASRHSSTSLPMWFPYAAPYKDVQPAMAHLRTASRNVPSVKPHDAPRFISDGEHIYTLHTGPKPGKDKVYYRCWRHREGCKMRATFELRQHQITLTGAGAHLVGCGIDNWRLASRKSDMLEQLKEKVANLAGDRTATPQSIWHKICEELDGDLLLERPTLFPTRNQVYNWIREVRGRTAGQGDDILQLAQVPDELREGVTLPWMRYYSKLPARIMFMLPKQENFLKNAEIWMVDGTFKCCPIGFEQMLNIMGCNDDQYLQCCHILVNGKNEITYRNALWQLFGDQDMTQLRVKWITIDFEPAMFHALEKISKHMDKVRGYGITVKGCLFHFSQALYRQYQKLYTGKKNVWGIRLFYILIWAPFIQEEQLQRFITDLTAKNCPDIQEYLAYFRRQWMPIQRWWRVEEGAPAAVQTNCALEGFHGHLNVELPRGRPDIFMLSALLLKLARNKLRDIDHDPKWRRAVSTKAKMWETAAASIRGRMAWFVSNVPEGQPGVVHRAVVVPPEPLHPEVSEDSKIPEEFFTALNEGFEKQDVVQALINDLDA